MKRITIIAFFTVALAACSPESTPNNPDTAKGDIADTQAEIPCTITPPATPVACTMEWRPVCGCDGVTYSNPCSAKAAGVERFEEGECGGEKLD